MRLSLTIILPAHNEKFLLADTVHTILKATRGQKSRILIVENGSIDNTFQIANYLSVSSKRIETIALTTACYGGALKKGIEHATSDLIAVFNVDYYDLVFLKKALELISKYDIITGSKTLPGSFDKRPLWRRLITKFFTLLLKIIFDYQGSDTHGIKVMRAPVAKKLAKKCQDFHCLFDTELMIRAERLKLRIKELPVTISEQRTPVSSIIGRIIRSPKELFFLYRALNLNKK